MRLNKILSLVLVASFAAIVSAPASAQRGGVGFGFSKVGKHSSIGIGININHGGGFYRPLPFYPRPTVVVDCYRQWIPAYYETQCVQVWVPGCGCERQVWVEPVYQTICEPCCGTRQVLVTAGYFRTVTENAGHFETRSTQVLIPGRYV